MPVTTRTRTSHPTKPLLSCKAHVAATSQICVLTDHSLVIPYLTYGFLGVEIVTVAAFEARKPRKSLRSSARWIAYVITLLFVLCGIGEALNVAWYDSRLPEMGEKAKIKTRDDSQQRASFSVLVLAARINGHLHAAGCWNAFLIVSCLSAANTALYVASRTLYGLCRELPQNEKSRLKRWPSKLGALDPRTRVPFWALLASTVVFFWLPFLHLKSGYSVQSVSTPSHHPCTLTNASFLSS